jgi:hypothetical protein
VAVLRNDTADIAYSLELCMGNVNSLLRLPVAGGLWTMW